ncbi:MAG: DUF6033 family protein [Lachnospiraceae bacterium]|nr:DUF6033 family protein [Lachnospiraceae bacterium]
MSPVTNNQTSAISAYQNTLSQAAGKTTESAQAKTTEGLGKTVGKPELSEEGKKYYDELKKKYSNMDFVLVSKDMKEVAKQQAGSYGNKNRMVVLIDEEKIERMATDEAYRAKYEGLISQAQTQLPQLQNALLKTPGAKTVGMQVKDDGKASFFAVMDKSMTAQRERVAAKRAEKKEAEKKAAKKAEKKEVEEKRAEKRAEKKEAEKAREKENIEDYTDDDWGEEGDYELLQAGSAEELIRMMEDWAMARRSEAVRTPAEELVGSHVDFRA